MIIIYILLVITAIFAYIFLKDSISRVKKGEDNSNFIFSLIVGFVTNFFDTLGVGSFAPTTAAFKFSKQVDDRLIPGTLNVSNTLPIALEAFIFIQAVKVDTLTLVSLIISSVAGAYLGAGIISKMEKRTIKIIMGFALVIVAFVMIGQVSGIIAGFGEGNTANGLSGAKLIIAIVIFFILGALMSAGVGLYAPAMATVYLLGLNPLIAFPIMMGSCAFLMPVGSIKFIKEKAYAPKVALAISIGGLIGVFIAAKFVTGLDVSLLIKLVIGVVLITSGMMLYEAFVKDVTKEKN